MAEKKSALTKKQAVAASKLRQERPPVLPGTNVILDDKKRSIWYKKVTRTMKNLKITNGDAANEFCNLAGVPD